MLEIIATVTTTSHFYLVHVNSVLIAGSKSMVAYVHKVYSASARGQSAALPAAAACMLHGVPDWLACHIPVASYCTAWFYMLAIASCCKHQTPGIVSVTTLEPADVGALLRQRTETTYHSCYGILMETTFLI